MTDAKQLLVRCPLCGADEGYTLDEGSTSRWWSVRCADCGQEVGEARVAFGPSPLIPPSRTTPADEEWTRAGAYADKLRAAIKQIAACENILTAFEIANVALHGVQGERPNGQGEGRAEGTSPRPQRLGVLYKIDVEKCLTLDTKPHILSTWAVHVARPKTGETPCKH